MPKIAKRTGVRKAVVGAGITVADSEFAGKIATKYEVTLDQAAAILDFEDTPKRSSPSCTSRRTPEQLRHEVQRQRDERARRQQVEAEQDTLREHGFNSGGRRSFG